MAKTNETTAPEVPSQLDNETLRARLEFGIWRESFERAHAAWTLAHSGLKPALLLRGQELADAESWLLSAASGFTKSERQFIYKSVSQSSARRMKQREDRNDELTESESRTRHFILAMALVILAVIGPGLMHYVILGPAGDSVARLVWPQWRSAITIGSPQPVAVAAARPPTVEPKPRPVAPPPRAAAPSPPPPPTPAQREQHLTSLSQRLAQKGDARGALLLAIEAADETRTPDAGPAPGRSPDAAPATGLGAILSQALMTRQPLAARRAWRQTGTSARFCDGGRIVLAAVDADTVQAWDVANGRDRVVVAGHPERLQAASFDRDCGRIALAGGEHGARIWSLTSGEPGRALMGHEADVIATRFSPDGRSIATGDQDRYARIWDVGSGRTLAVLRGHEDAITAIDFSPDGRRVVTASQDKTARLWETANGRAIVSLEGHLGIVTSAAFSPDGRRILTTSWDGTAMLWDAATGRSIARIQIERTAIMAASFNRDGNFIGGITQSNEAYVWHGATGQQLATLTGHADPVRSLEFSPDGRWLATVSWSGPARLWQTGTWTQASVLDVGEDRAQALAFQSAGDTVTVLTMGGTLISWPLFASVEEALTRAKQGAPACLSAAERTTHGLDPRLPAWCAQFGKLPLDKSAMNDRR